VEAVPGTPMQWHWEGGKVHVKLEKLDIYTIIALQVDALP
jgi:hypothetical protein